MSHTKWQLFSSTRRLTQLAGDASVDDTAVCAQCANALAQAVNAHCEFFSFDRQKGWGQISPYKKLRIAAPFAGYVTVQKDFTMATHGALAATPRGKNVL